MKTCIACGGEFELGEFYAHPEMADGHLNKCKSCCKGQSTARGQAKREEIKEYDKQREQDPERKAKKLDYQRKQRKEHPEKYLAREQAERAVKSGKLKKLPCEVCGAEAQMHHDDYSKPLEVRWLCFIHHRQRHGQLGYLEVQPDTP